MMSLEEACKTLQRNKCLIWLFMEVFNEYGEGGSKMPSSIKLGAGGLLDALYADLERLENYIQENVKGG
jgi:hypothetical protein